MAPGVTRSRNVRSRCRCSMCPAIHINSRSWLRSSSTHEPSDPPHRVVQGFGVDGLATDGPEFYPAGVGFTRKRVVRKKKRGRRGLSAVWRSLSAGPASPPCLQGRTLSSRRPGKRDSGAAVPATHLRPATRRPATDVSAAGLFESPPRAGVRAPDLLGSVQPAVRGVLDRVGATGAPVRQ